jgi:Na+/melibiose symporter-like transporter
VFERLPEMVKKWGPGKSVIYFYGILMMLEVAILMFFMAYGSIALQLVAKPYNLTIWGIGNAPKPF